MNGTWKSLGIVLALTGGLMLWGCDDNGGSDAGMTSEDGGGGGSDAGGGGGPVVGFGSTRATLTPADFSCRGMVTAPDDAGDMISFVGAVTDFQNDTPVEGLTVHVFPDNQPADGCTGSCLELTSDAMGNVTLMDNASSWFAYRILAGSGTTAGLSADYIEVVQVNAVAAGTAGGMVTLNAVQETTRNTIVTLLGVSLEDGTATITGSLTDCGGETIANANIRVFEATSGNQIELGFGRNGPREFYFGSTGLPGSAERNTNVGGLYGAANLPIPSDGLMRVELWGSLADGEPAEMLTCETAEVIEDGITIVSATPARSDGPSGCSM